MANIELSTKVKQIADDNEQTDVQMFDHTPNGSNQTNEDIDMVNEGMANDIDVTRKKNMTVIYQVNDRPPIFLAILLGFQVFKVSYLSEVLLSL